MGVLFTNSGVFYTCVSERETHRETERQRQRERQRRRRRRFRDKLRGEKEEKQETIPLSPNPSPPILQDRLCDSFGKIAPRGIFLLAKCGEMPFPFLCLRVSWCIL